MKLGMESVPVSYLYFKYMACIAHHNVLDLSAARDSVPTTMCYCFANVVFTLNCKVCMLSTEQAVAHQMAMGEDRAFVRASCNHDQEKGQCPYPLLLI